MYHLFFIILLFSVLLEASKISGKRLFNFLGFLLFLFLVLRYGQGSDYFNYVYQLNLSADQFDKFVTTGNVAHIVKEPGFAFISYLFLKLLQLPVELLIALYSGVAYILYLKFLKKYCTRPVLGLFIFYCVFFLVYPFSAIRQSICLSIFVYYMAEMLYNRKYGKYYLLCIILFTIHNSSIILFTLPIFNYIKLPDKKLIFAAVVLCIFIGAALSKVIFNLFAFTSILEDKLGYYNSSSISLDYVSLLFRMILLFIILQNIQYYTPNSLRELFLKIYILGFLIYALLFASPIISSRLTAFMRYSEAILLADYIIYNSKKIKAQLPYYLPVIALVSIVYFKNIDSFIEQGQYNKSINVINYPYVSIFNKDDILRIRYIPPYYLNNFID